jgi:hypothetical protein
MIGARGARIVTAALVLISAVCLVSRADAAMRIADDRGGRIGTYIDKYEALKASNETVVIDGMCASACTIVLGTISPDRICITPKANLGFHAAWDFGPGGRQVTNAVATRMLYQIYPTHIKRWISRRGGLKPGMIFLRGRELAGMYKPCYMDAQASGARTH